MTRRLTTGRWYCFNQCSRNRWDGYHPAKLRGRCILKWQHTLSKGELNRLLMREMK